MKISIITPSYNRAEFIEKTIDSVLSQTYRDFEYFVIDGGSCDGTIDILERYQKKGFLKYISEPDQGMYDAINKGMGIAGGDILAYLNSDDQYLPWTLEAVAGFMRDKPFIDLAVGDSMVVDYSGGFSKLNIFPVVTNQYLESGHIIPQASVFMKRRVFDRVGPFQKDVSLIADCEYWLRAIENNFRIGKIREILAVENNHEGTLRSQHEDLINIEKAFLLAKYKSCFKKEKTRKLYMKIKFVEQEVLYFWFKLLLLSGPGNTSHWRFFRKNVFCRFDLVKHYLSKLNLYPHNKGVWDIKF